ncbi:MAG: hypothetical protein CMJ48_04725, partial [Planctomycetaceae bacterium]|nr:hypothetical protein [Planctomycetaceae bacterium]
MSSAPPRPPLLPTHVELLIHLQPPQPANRQACREEKSGIGANKFTSRTHPKLGQGGIVGAEVTASLAAVYNERSSILAKMRTSRVCSEMRMRSMLRRFVIASCLLTATTAIAQDEDFPPGMHARYAAAGETVERIDPGVQFVWGSDSPDPRIPQGEFTVEWTSQLLVRQEGKFRFHAYVQGDLSVSLDDRVVLKGSANQPVWISGNAIEPGFGEKALAVRFRKKGDSARVQLFWSSDAFPLEPIPAQLLFRDGDSPGISAVERGREQFEAHRCASCHQRDNLRAPLPAPSLAHIAGGTSFEWIARQIADPSSASAHARMPHFGFSDDESRAITAFLVSVAKQPSLQKPGKQAKKATVPDDRAGQILLRSTGCLACHAVGEQGTQRTYGGHDLARVGEKRSVDWLYTWLAKPETLNPQHRMPLFKLSSTERRQLARHLTTLKTSDFKAGKPPR